MKTISQDIGISAQSAVFTKVIACKGHKLRIRIESDSYAFQCSARIERWDGNAWREVHSLHHSNMATETGLAYKARHLKGKDPAWFADDTATLINVAIDIL